jgi:predicted phosphodiesterase
VRPVRVAALYDVHGNLPALEAVLADRRCASADTVVCGGDLCAGPMPADVLSLMEQQGAVFVRGNADRDLHGWPAEQLSAAQLATLRSWPTTVTLDIDGLGAVTFCHGSPRSDDEIITRVTPDEAVEEACAGLPLVVGGHTHVQFDRTTEATRMVNAGSVGMPYEGRRGAFWALLGPQVELVSTEYDVDDAAGRIRATGYPEADDCVETLTSPPSAEEATSIFEGQRGA